MAVDHHEVVVYQLVGAAALFAASLAVALIASSHWDMRNGRPCVAVMIKLLSAAATGGVLASATCFVAPAGNADLNALDPSYPSFFAFATGTIACLFALQKELCLIMGNARNDLRLPRDVMFVHEMHLVLLGFSLGLLSHKDETIAVLVSFACYRLADSAVLGGILADRSIRPRQVFAQTALSSCAPCIAIAVGVGVNACQKGRLASGVLEAMAFGAMIFVALTGAFPSLFNVNCFSSVPLAALHSVDQTDISYLHLSSTKFRLAVYLAVAVGVSAVAGSAAVADRPYSS